ncbi:heavy metal-binding domain-containing protein [Vagococcus entomophilus]|uniref:UPF0145 protein CBF30_03115 n=1 Tax=Vagococcus entomophilus TaxID=1160095 RepID=A0A430AJF6_9ENTE|nr:YbjQ family protein [Vagococcus entomophilus]RSU08246.1 hypothetical protein CBF30_03115 [Vagococcus entomophilus]
MKIVTTETIATQKISEIKGAIFSEQVISVNIVKDALSGIKGIFGGKSHAYSAEYKKARELALIELKDEAKKLAANAIVDVQLHFNQFINSDIMLIVVTASGTAAVIAQNQPNI